MRIELLGGTSHLLQMRGLKLSRNILLICICMSHLLQMRGLKHLGLDRKHHRHEVASFTDAWIETPVPPADVAGPIVASFTDAWIETGLIRIELLGGTSRIFYRCVD